MPKPTEGPPRPLPGPMLPGMDDFSPARRKLLDDLCKLHNDIEQAETLAMVIRFQSEQAGADDYAKAMAEAHEHLTAALQLVANVPGGLR